MNTLLRLLCALLAVTCVALPLSAQSVFHFPRVAAGAGSVTNLTITNLSPSPAEVEFELFALDGRLAPLAINPVRYRIESDSVLSMSTDTIFATSEAAGWIRVSSEQSGLTARLLTGDLVSRLEGIGGTSPIGDQLVVVPIDDPLVVRELRVVNPSEGLAGVNVTVFDSQGNAIGTIPVALEAHAGADLNLAPFPTGVAARISASRPILAQAVLSANSSLMLLNGQAASELAAPFRVAPHAVIGNGFESTLILSNPTGQSINVFATYFSETGSGLDPSQSAPPRQRLSIPANGSVSVGVGELTGLGFNPPSSGWIEIESPNVPLVGALVVSGGTNRTAHRLQTEPRADMLYSNAADFEVESVELVLSNLEFVDAELELLAIDENGFVITTASAVVGGRSKQTLRVRDLLPRFDLNHAGFLAVKSSAPIFSVGVLTGINSRGLEGFEPEVLAEPFEPLIAPIRPRITSVEPQEVRPGDSLQILTGRLDLGSSLLFSDGVIDSDPFVAFGITVFNIEVPSHSPGFVDIRIRSSDGTESAPHTILVLPSDQTPLREVRGRAFYEKIDLGPDGLDLSQPVMVPIREARIDVFDPLTGEVFSVGGTDRHGNFRAVLPFGSDSILRALSQSSDSVLTVADNTRGGAIYFVSTEIDAEVSPLLVASDATRASGAFNILEVVRQGNDFLLEIDPDLRVPNLNVFWSPNNRAVAGNIEAGQIGGTFFNAETNTAFMLGDRATDSDEFDDSVILHEYAHLLATQFSRDDSPGGAHLLGDVLDPRVAWSEGWANFFSAWVRDNPIYRDSLGFGGESVLEHNLEDNVIIGDQPGYWSEFSIHSILWDLADSSPDTGDNFQVPFDAIWEAFLQLSDDSFVYVPSFLDRLTSLLPAEAFGIEQLARFGSIDYVASAEPSVSNPFPRFVPATGAVTGEVDSLSRRRANLAQSAHLYVFDVSDGAVSIRLDITGLGPGQNPNANDLDLFLLDSQGRVLARSDRGLNGQSELISRSLPAGRYVVEIRSFYTQGETGTFVFNSGSYNLRIAVQWVTFPNESGSRVVGTQSAAVDAVERLQGV